LKGTSRKDVRDKKKTKEVSVCAGTNKKLEGFSGLWKGNISNGYRKKENCIKGERGI